MRVEGTVTDPVGALIPGATVLGDDSVTFERVSTDSRSAGPGDLFVAIKGERFDAHDFLPEVASRNVTAVLLTRAPDNWHVPALRVADTRVALGALVTPFYGALALAVLADLKVRKEGADLEQRISATA